MASFILVNKAGYVLFGIAGGLSELRSDAVRFETREDAELAAVDLIRWGDEQFFVDTMPAESQDVEVETETTKDDSAVTCPECKGNGSACFVCLGDGFIPRFRLTEWENMKNDAIKADYAYQYAIDHAWDADGGYPQD